MDPQQRDRDHPNYSGSLDSDVTRNDGMTNQCFGWQNQSGS
jgi:hypothetical protein